MVEPSRVRYEEYKDMTMCERPSHNLVVYTDAWRRPGSVTVYSFRMAGESWLMTVFAHPHSYMMETATLDTRAECAECVHRFLLQWASDPLV